MSSPASELKTLITDDMKSAMKAGEKQKLGTIRLILSAVKQREVDERIELKDEDIITILDKMAKQRRESIEQFAKADRNDLIEIESAEIDVIKLYLPKALSDEEVNQIITDAISESGASSMKEMGKVMGIIKPKLQGRADMGAVSKLIKTQLS